MVHQHVLLFPVMLLEDAMKVAGSPQQLLQGGPGGTYVYTTCPIPNMYRSVLSIKWRHHKGIDLLAE